ncbi:hypothetical protein ACAW63_25775 [Pseudomonas sp. QE6]|uniref:hypothetical protein n=1 Tax=Pseudomonas sp. QE6 TaxID=3242491 RepID=UPI003529471A
MGWQAEQAAVPGALISIAEDKKGPPRAGLFISAALFCGQKKGRDNPPTLSSLVHHPDESPSCDVLTGILTGLRLSVYAGVILLGCRVAATGAFCPTRPSLRLTQSNKFFIKQQDKKQ